MEPSSGLRHGICMIKKMRRLNSFYKKNKCFVFKDSCCVGSDIMEGITKKKNSTSETIIDVVIRENPCFWKALKNQIDRNKQITKKQN